MANIPSFSHSIPVRTPGSGSANLPPQVLSTAGPTELVDFGSGSHQEPGLLSPMRFERQTGQAAPAQEPPVQENPVTKGSSNSPEVTTPPSNRVSSGLKDICPQTGQKIQTDASSGGATGLQATTTGSLAWLDTPVPPDPVPQPKGENFSFADWAHEQMQHQPRKETNVDQNVRLFEMDVPVRSLDSLLMEDHYRGY